MKNRIRNQVERALRSPFARNVGILSQGYVIAQAVTLLSLPLITRIYDPHDFELLAVYVALVVMISAFSSLRLDIAIPLPKQDDEACNLLVLAMIAPLCIALALALTVFLMPAVLAEILGQPLFQPLLWMVPVGVLLASIYSTLQYWSTRKKYFGDIASTQITRAVSRSGVQLGVGLFNPTAFGLLLGHMLYYGVGLIALGRHIRRELHMIIKHATGRSLKRVLNKYRRFPLYSVPESLMDTAGVHLPILIIAAVPHHAEGGYLILAMKALESPIALISYSISNVYLSEARQMQRDRSLGPITRKIMWRMIKFGAPPLLLLGIAAPLIFPLVFGADWGRAGVIVMWMTPCFILQAVSSPVLTVLHITQRQSTAMTLQAVGLVLRVGAVLLAFYYFDDWVVEFFAVSGALFYLLYILVILRISRFE